MTFSEWQDFAHDVRERANRVSHMITDRARAECAAAGLDPQLLGIHPHNAMVSYRAGRPWREVDYRRCRRTLWLIERSYEPGRIANRIIARAWAKHVAVI